MVLKLDIGWKLQLFYTGELAICFSILAHHQTVTDWHVFQRRLKPRFAVRRDGRNDCPLTYKIVIGDDTKAAARQSPNCIKKTKKIK